MSSEHVKNLTQENYDAEINQGVVLVDFWAPWCGPCRMLAPVIDQLAEQYKGRASICKVNVDEQQELAGKNGVKGIPAIFFYKDGKVVDTHVGAASKAIFEEKLNKIL